MADDNGRAIDRSLIKAEVYPGAANDIEAMAEAAGGWVCEQHPHLPAFHEDADGEECAGPGVLRADIQSRAAHVPPNGALVGTALVGGAMAQGLIEGPIKINLPRVYDAIREQGGVRLARDEAVDWAVALVKRTAPFDPSQADDAERMMRELFEEQYDELDGHIEAAEAGS